MPDEVHSAISRLDDYASELNRLSEWLHKLQVEFEPIDIEYNAFVDKFELGLYARTLQDGSKLPAQAMQLKLARQEMPPELLGAYEGMIRKRERLQGRIGDLKKLIDAERSILSAHKEIASV